jgi:hypothetical protein
VFFATHRPRTAPFRRRREKRPLPEIHTRPCETCGETTTSVVGYFCGGCHFAGWWGKWKVRRG